MQTDNVGIFSRKALVAFVVAIISALGTLVATLNNTAQISSLKDQNVRIEQKLKPTVTPIKDKEAIIEADQKANSYKRKADQMEKKAVELQKDNELLKRQVPNAKK